MCAVPQPQCSYCCSPPAPISFSIRTATAIFRRRCGGLTAEDVYLTSADGVRLHAWLLPSTVPSKATILFLHGNAQNISAHIGNVAWLPSQGYNVFLLDYRGYGLSQGAPQLPGLFADIEAAADYIALREDLNRVPFVILGQSLGGAPCER